IGQVHFGRGLWFAGGWWWLCSGAAPVALVLGGLGGGAARQVTCVVWILRWWSFGGTVVW
ncbi:hypothetical protein A2U01_0055739, partial [Trifolium medium]|nr:hypothetical protein [Trifolium medium]